MLKERKAALDPREFRERPEAPPQLEPPALRDCRAPPERREPREPQEALSIRELPDPLGDKEARAHKGTWAPLAQRALPDQRALGRRGLPDGPELKARQAPLELRAQRAQPESRAQRGAPGLRGLRVPRDPLERRGHKDSREPRETLVQKALRALKGRRARKEMSARSVLRVRSGRLASFQDPWDRPRSCLDRKDRKALRGMMDTPGRRALKDCQERQVSQEPLVRRARKVLQGRQELRDCQGLPRTRAHPDRKERKDALEPRAPRAEMEVPH